MAIYTGASKSKLFTGTTKIKQIYLGNEKIYSAGNIVTYVVDTNVSYQEEIDEGDSALKPISFTPSKAGWTFAGWRTDKTASAPLSSMIMGETPITLYAVFTQTITLSYNGNGNTGGSVATQTGLRYYNTGNINNPVFTLLANGFIRAGYTFRTWALGGTSGTRYGSGTKLTLSSNTVLYALWYAPWNALINGAAQSGCTIAASHQNGHSYGAGIATVYPYSVTTYNAYVHTNGVVPCALSVYTGWMSLKNCDHIEILPLVYVWGDGGFADIHLIVSALNASGASATIADTVITSNGATAKYTYTVTNYRDVSVQLRLTQNNKNANQHMTIGLTNIRLY